MAASITDCSFFPELFISLAKFRMRNDYGKQRNAIKIRYYGDIGLALLKWLNRVPLAKE